jgi:rubredoxin
MEKKWYNSVVKIFKGKTNYFIRKGDQSMAEYECTVCGYIYKEADGCEEQGVAPGTKWADVPDSFECPLCGASKEDFEQK